MSNRGKSLWSMYWPFLLPVLLLLPRMADFVYPGSGAPYSDMAVTHFPNALFLKRSLLEQGSIPVWSHQILAGFPFIAHPYSGLWYPPAWLAIIFPLPLGLNLLVAVHLMLAGIGTYLFLSKYGISRSAAVFGGLAFQFAPKLFAHYGAGHLMLVVAVCLTPWLFYFFQSYYEAGRSSIRQPAILLALIFLADPRWALYAGVAAFTVQLAHSHKDKLWKVLVVLAKQGGLTLLLVLPVAVLYGQYALLSTRADLTVHEVLTLSLPFGQLLGLLLPQFSAFHEWVLYPGFLVLMLALFGLITRQAKFTRIPWPALLLAALLLSLGENIPGMQLLSGLPGFSLLRVPPRALFLAAFALVVLAAGGLDALLVAEVDRRQGRLTLAALIGLALSLGTAVFLLDGRVWAAALWTSLGLGVFWLLWAGLLAERLSRTVFLLAISALLLLDLGSVDQSLLRFRSKDKVLSEGRAVAEFLEQQPDDFRVYSPSYSLPQQTAAAHSLQLADGVDPLQFAPYTEFMVAASGVPLQGYSVSLPPFSEGLPADANRGAIPDAELLGLLNVRYVVAEFPLQVAGLKEVEQIGGSYIYLNEAAMPRAGVESGGGLHAVENLELSSNQISIVAQGPARLVLAEVDYPGWIAEMDGERVALERYQGILRSVQIPAGEHEVVFTFRPLGLFPGLLLSGLVWVALILRPRRRQGWTQ